MDSLQGLNKNGNASKMIIAGPCSAESPEQLLETARALQQCGGVDYFRAGLWKPRTSPDSFQGVGETGLDWLEAVRRETGMKVATEIACEKHVAVALKHNVDLLWLGARTVSNPFVVQDIADALRGTDIPVLVKNPLNPDIELWYGAINRLIKAGVREVGAIHRGFSVWGTHMYRNQPIWRIPAELMERMPGITIVCDPSHIAGKSSLVPLVAERALENGTGGLMVEVHPDPPSAMSDASQQLTPAAFTSMMKDLDLGRKGCCNDAPDQIDELSSEMDMVDELLVHAIASRMELSRKIASMRPAGSPKPSAAGKSAAGERLADLASGDGLRPGFISRLFGEIARESGKPKYSVNSGFKNRI